MNTDRYLRRVVLLPVAVVGTGFRKSHYTLFKESAVK